MLQGATVLATALLASAASPALACSFGPSWVPYEGKSFSFLGRPQPDTVLTGPGDVDVGDSFRPGHFGPGRPRVIYGQRLAVDRLGLFAQSVLPAGASEVILVPWDYGPDCSPLPWNRSARWLTPADTGLFQGSLRAAKHWVDGVPTLDVFVPQHNPYPQAFDRVVGRYSPGRLRLEARELLALLDSLPLDRDDPTPASALETARHWWRAGGRERRYPFDELMSRARMRYTHLLAQEHAPRMGGLYRVHLQWEGASRRTLYLRIGDAMVTESPGAPAAADADGYAPPTVESLSFAALVGRTPEVPLRCSKDAGGVYRYGYITAAFRERGTRGPHWLHLDTPVLESALSEDELRERRQRAAEQGRREFDRRKARRDSLLQLGTKADSAQVYEMFRELLKSTTPLRFERNRRGRARFSGTQHVVGIGDVRIDGTQLDGPALRCLDTD